MVEGGTGTPAPALLLAGLTVASASQGERVRPGSTGGLRGL